MKKYILFYLLLAFIVGCTCEEEELILEEMDIPNPFLVDSLRINPEEVRVHFNKPIDPASCILNETVLLDIENGSFNGDFYYQEKTLLFLVCDIESTTSTPNIVLTLMGEGATNQVKSMENQALDGDKNGTDGGIYSDSISINICELSPVGEPLQIDTVAYTLGNVIIQFNQPIDPATVILNESVLVDLGGSDFVGTLEIGPESISFKECDFNCDFPSCSATITLKGTETTGIKSLTGRLFDGDNDNEDGGDFSAQQEISSCDMFTVLSTTYDDQNLRIDFNKPIDPASFVLGESVYANPTGSTFVGAIVFESSAIVLNGCDFNCAFPECNATILLSGVKSLDDQVLDGDGDGVDGGTFSTTQVINSCEMFGVQSASLVGDGVRIEFNKTIDPASFVLNSTVFVAPSGSTFTGSFIFEPNAVMFNACDFNCGFPSCDATIRLSGVKSLDGQFLDGDNNGTDGGDFISTQNIASCSQAPYVISPTGDQFSIGCEPFFSSSLTINFSEPMDRNSVIFGQTLFFIETAYPLSYQGLNWIDDTQLIIQYFGDCGLSGIECSSVLQLVGTDNGNGAVMSQTGLSLDGNNDGTPGGNYELILSYRYEDYAPPVAICQDELFMDFPFCSEDDIIELDVDFFDKGSFDNCYSSLTRLIRRIGGCAGNSNFGNTILIYPCDYDVPPTIELLVVDFAGNQSICTTTFTLPQSSIVTQPEAFQQASFDYEILELGTSGKPDFYYSFQVEVGFELPVDTSNVYPESTIALVDNFGNSIPIALEWLDAQPTSANNPFASRLRVFTTVDIYNYCDPYVYSTCYFTLFISGCQYSDDGVFGIKDTNGIYLDGNEDGTPGGDYYTTFEFY